MIINAPFSLVKSPAKAPQKATLDTAQPAPTEKQLAPVSLSVYDTPGLSRSFSVAFTSKKAVSDSEKAQAADMLDKLVDFNGEKIFAKGSYQSDFILKEVEKNPSSLSLIPILTSENAINDFKKEVHTPSSMNIVGIIQNFTPGTEPQLEKLIEENLGSYEIEKITKTLTPENAPVLDMMMDNKDVFTPGSYSTIMSTAKGWQKDVILNLASLKAADTLRPTEGTRMGRYLDGETYRFGMDHVAQICASLTPEKTELLEKLVHEPAQEGHAYKYNATEISKILSSNYLTLNK